MKTYIHTGGYCSGQVRIDVLVILGTDTRCGENCGIAVKPKNNSDIARFASLHSHSQSRQQIPNSKLPCSILVLGINQLLDKNCLNLSTLFLSLSLSLCGPAAS